MWSINDSSTYYWRTPTIKYWHTGELIYLIDDLSSVDFHQYICSFFRLGDIIRTPSLISLQKRETGRDMHTIDIVDQNVPSLFFKTNFRSEHLKNTSRVNRQNKSSRTLSGTNLITTRIHLPSRNRQDFTSLPSDSIDTSTTSCTLP